MKEASKLYLGNFLLFDDLYSRPVRSHSSLHGKVTVQVESRQGTDSRIYGNSNHIIRTVKAGVKEALK